MTVISSGWKQRTVGVWEKKIGSRNYCIVNKSGYFVVSYINLGEVMSYYRNVDTCGTFELATLVAELHYARK